MNRYSSRADAMISLQYTEWNVVEIRFNRDGECIDVAIATVCTTDGKPPKEIDNARINTAVFRGRDYEAAQRYARHIISELNVKAEV